MSTQSRRTSSVFGAALAVFAVANAKADNDDPSGRAARLSYVHGTTSFSPAGETEWVDTVVNRPFVSGDRLWTDKDGRAELEVGGSALRLDANTSFELVNLDDHTTQVQVTQGTLDVSLRHFSKGQNYEVDTPTTAVTLAQAGQYRIEVDADGQHTTVAVIHGSAEALGDNANYPLQAGDRIRFHDTNLSDAEQLGAPAADEFDRFSAERDARVARSASFQYVGDDVVGVSDLDEYGSWSAQADYGHVWYPSHVESNWAPYSDGRWIWQDPWGWTWVDNAPWGFAPSHYGRWISVDNRWGWVPGPRGDQAVYAPALVAFVGGGGWSVGISAGSVGPIGWFPLGAREVYEPSYHASRDYFTRVNVTNTTVNNTTITNVYNNYSSGQPLAQTHYVNRAIPGAVTVVPGNVFANAQPVRAAAIKMDGKQMASAQVTRVAPVVPSVHSVIGSAGAAKAAPSNAIVERKVVARTAPPAKLVPFAARQQELQRTPGRPLAPSAIAALQPRTATTPATQNVRVLGPQASAVNARAAHAAHAAPALESKASPQASATTPSANASASDQKPQSKHKVASPPSQAMTTRERDTAAASSDRQKRSPAKTQERADSASAQPQTAASAHAQERKAAAAGQQQQQQAAASAHAQERKAAAAEQQQQQQAAASAHAQERKSAVAEQQQQQAAASAHAQERKSAAAAQQQQQATASAHAQERKSAAAEQQQQQAAASAHAQERKSAAVEQQQPRAPAVQVREHTTAASPPQQNGQRTAPQRNLPAAHQKAKDTDKNDESKDADKKDRGGKSEGK